MGVSGVLLPERLAAGLGDSDGSGQVPGGRVGDAMFETAGR